ncbi:hypothetical protein H6G80_03940 [Nostoc sp. FACHB-87]|uniref:hypothetical protein n=1 Tax=Nostocaceae TaxID=1162 RepID=UPI001686D000|nr:MULTISPECIES: hypothetical protein [Nostocaceae]MBD2298946.1 hypothetical protein [Nostoc sp. FACHB-190]MBD2453226.1 hypothetical protein [Nostoc sp. FACHB-87]MBD2474994.1 hypothetical protein [Anabaena sp. FACHB-83]
MNQHQINQSVEERDRLSHQCHQLVDKIANHRYAIKLLRVAIKSLQTIASYKMNRLKVVNHD